MQRRHQRFAIGAGYVGQCRGERVILAHAEAGEKYLVGHRLILRYSPFRTSKGGYGNEANDQAQGTTGQTANVAAPQRIEQQESGNYFQTNGRALRKTPANQECLRKTLPRMADNRANRSRFTWPRVRCRKKNLRQHQKQG